MYAYHELIYDLIRLDVFQKEMSFFSIGSSYLGQNLFCVKSGMGPKNILVVAGHHSLETILSEVIMEYLFRSKNEWFQGVSFYTVPLLNPDGADIVVGRIKHPRFSSDRSRWQANYRGVDLNHNYDAGFFLAKELVKKDGITAPNHTKYGGEEPFSEPETRAIRDLCKKIPFDVAVALHSQGEEIYYEYDGVVPEGTEQYLNTFRKNSHYTITKPTGTASHGGMKDWFIKTYQKPAFTIEAGLGKNPLPHSLFSKLYADCKVILDSVIETVRNEPKNRDI
ncbi:MAG: hypothetical protein J6A61_01435 [Clostridia bacterium]|nr:hypothetical protein [Clostridia bacterium]